MTVKETISSNRVAQNVTGIYCKPPASCTREEEIATPGEEIPLAGMIQNRRLNATMNSSSIFEHDSNRSGGDNYHASATSQVRGVHRSCPLARQEKRKIKIGHTPRTLF